MTERTEKSLLTRRVAMLLAAGFAGLALLLCAIGIYGVLAYVVTQRTREIGIRIALGGTRRRIFELIVREGTLLIAIGFGCGAVGIVALRRTLESQLYGVGPTDPFVLALVAGLLGAVALVACAVPALRATSVDPVHALNPE